MSVNPHPNSVVRTTHRFCPLAPLTCEYGNTVLPSNATIMPKVLTDSHSLCMQSRHIYKQIKHKGTLLWKLCLSCKLYPFQGSPSHCSASVRTHGSSLISASAQNVVQHHCHYSLMGCFIQPSNPMEICENCLVEDKSAENHGLMKQIHQTGVKCIFNLCLLSSVIPPIY